MPKNPQHDRVKPRGGGGVRAVYTMCKKTSDLVENVFPNSCNNHRMTGHTNVFRHPCLFWLETPDVCVGLWVSTLLWATPLRTRAVGRIHLTLRVGTYSSKLSGFHSNFASTCPAFYQFPTLTLAGTTDV